MQLKSIRRKNVESTKLNTDSNDVEYLKGKITYYEEMVQDLTKEKNSLVQELEKTKYQLMKKNNETEEKYLNKETELRRHQTKYKTMEIEIKTLLSSKTDEKKKNRDLLKQLESISMYMYSSYSYLKESVGQFKSIIKQGLVLLGLVK